MNINNYIENPNKATKAICWARISCSKQAQGLSLEEQKEITHEYRRLTNMDLLEDFSVVESSTRGKRSEFHKMIKSCEEQKETVAIIFTSIDRLQRGFKESNLLDALVLAGKIELHSVHDDMILTSKSSAEEVKKYRFLTAEAEEFASNISQRTRQAMEIMRRSGRYPGHAPIGFINTHDEYGNKYIALDGNKVLDVAELFCVYAQGDVCLNHLVTMADERGLTSNFGKKLTRRAMKDILSNSFYCGKMHSKGVCYRHIYPCLVDEEKFGYCQELLSAELSKHSKKVCKYDLPNHEEYIINQQRAA